MSFGNTRPKKFGKGKEKPKSWECGCGVAQPRYILWCKQCGRGQ